MPSRAGSPNKNKQALIALLQAKYPGYHPVMELAAIANNDVICDICKGKGVIEVSIGADLLGGDEQDRYISQPCEHCVDGKTVITMDMKFNANKEVAQYVTPKLKAVEHSGMVEGTVYIPVIKRFDGSVDESSD